MDRILTTIETLPNGKIGLNVFTNESWIRHIFSDIETFNKYYNRAAGNLDA